MTIYNKSMITFLLLIILVCVVCISTVGDDIHKLCNNYEEWKGKKLFEFFQLITIFSVAVLLALASFITLISITFPVVI